MRTIVRQLQVNVEDKNVKVSHLTFTTINS